MTEQPIDNKTANGAPLLLIRTVLFIGVVQAITLLAVALLFVYSVKGCHI